MKSPAMHPYVPFRVIPNPPSCVISPLDTARIERAHGEHIALISKRNRALIPQDIYERMKGKALVACKSEKN